MGSITNTCETEMLDHVLNQLNYASPTTVYLGLATADPTDAATGASANECANSNAYARTAISLFSSIMTVVHCLLEYQTPIRLPLLSRITEP